MELVSSRAIYSVALLLLCYSVSYFAQRMHEVKIKSRQLVERKIKPIEIDATINQTVGSYSHYVKYVIV